MHQSSNFLEKALRVDNLLSADQCRVVNEEKENRGCSLRDLVVSLGFISEGVLQDIETQRTGIASLDISKVVLDPDVLTVFPKHWARQHQVIPLFQRGKGVHVALVNPRDLLARDRVRGCFKEKHTFTYYHVTQRQFLALFEKAYERSVTLEDIFQEMDQQKRLKQEDPENPTVRLVQALLVEGVRLRASDIHLEPEEYFIRVRHRVDGHLSQSFTFHRRHWKALCVRLKIMANLDIAETRFPQDGRFSLLISGRAIDFRVSFHPTQFGENVVIRLLDKSEGVKGLRDLGFPSNQVRTLEALAKTPQGLVVFTGPTGSGKTTTLYGLLSHQAAMHYNIMTLEQPIEYQLPLIRQTSVVEGGRLTFAEGVRSLLRQDPDILLVGEIRDAATAKAALRATLTGHQVYTTLHTGDSFMVVQRLVDLGLRMEDFLPHLRCVVNQRLVRRKCGCQRGCERCHHTGYFSRMPLAEILLLEEGVRDLFLRKTSLQHIRNYMVERGFQSIQSQAQLLLHQGITTKEEVLLALGEEAP